jgi:hydrogenase maturation factor
MTSKVETITPEKAREYLHTISKQRQIRPRIVGRYAADMRSGHWLLTHQGIAFNALGQLVDGQHRMKAIVLANHPVEMMVTRDIAVSVVCAWVLL